MPKPGPRTTYKYSEGFKATAGRLSHLPGVAVQDVAQSLFIHPFMLSRWRKQVREGLIMAKGQGYQTLINDALRQHLATRGQPVDSKTLRRILREELGKS